MTWIDGYVTDVGYPAFFYKEMQPVWLSAVTHALGFAAPDTGLPFRQCELGCGIGVNLLVAAACHPQARFLGVDLNADHLRCARDAASASGLQNIEFIHSDFAEFSGGDGAPFDLITSHGVWSWVAPPHQTALLDVAAARLKPGGLFYLHYMCHPGSTELAAVQQVLNVFAHHIPGTSADRVQAGLKLLRQMSEGGLFSDRPDMRRHLDNLAHQDPNHLAHEFLTDHWRPQHSAQVHQQVGAAGFSYLGSADVFNNLDPSLSVPGRFQDVIKQTRAPALAETLKDLTRGSHQRMDIFQKAPRPLGREEQETLLGAMTFALQPGAPASGPVSFSTPIGPIAGPEELISSLLTRLAQGPASFDELARLTVFSGQPGLLLQSLQLLMLQEIAHPLKPKTQAKDAPEPDPPHALTQWFGRNGISLRVLDTFGTAVRSEGL